MMNKPCEIRVVKCFIRYQIYGAMKDFLEGIHCMEVIIGVITKV
ncbi:hypothetical protein EZS27_034184, partial [termite gut metagenome]